MNHPRDQSSSSFNYLSPSQDPPRDNSSTTFNSPSTSMTGTNHNQYTPDNNPRRKVRGEGYLNESSLNPYEHLSPSFNDSNIRNDSLMMNTVDSRLDISMSRNNNETHDTFVPNNASTLNLNNLSIMTSNSMNYTYFLGTDIDTERQYGTTSEIERGHHGTSVAVGIGPEEEHMDEWMKMATINLLSSIEGVDGKEHKEGSLPESTFNPKCPKKLKSQGELLKWKQKEKGRGGRGGSSSGSIGIWRKFRQKINTNLISSNTNDERTSKSMEHKEINNSEANDDFAARSTLMEKEMASRIMDNLRKLTDQLDEDKWFYESIEYVSDPLL